MGNADKSLNNDERVVPESEKLRKKVARLERELAKAQIPINASCLRV